MRRANALARSALLCCSFGCGGAPEIEIGFHVTGGAAGYMNGPSQRPCLPEWAAPEPVVELNTPGADCGGHITADGLRLYFDIQQAGNWELYLASRPDPGATFARAELISELSSANAEADPVTTFDELELYFTGDRDGGNCIFRAERAERSLPWANPTRLSELCPVPAVGPAISGDGLTLYYNESATMSPLGTVMITTRASRAEAFPPGLPVPALSASAGMLWGYPSLAPDGLSLFVTGSSSDGDLYALSRPDTQSDFDAPVPLSSINSNWLDGDASVTADGSQFFFASSRAGSVDLYRSLRTCR
jgi:hypothetical protein